MTEDDSERGDAWAGFLEEYGPLIHLAARKNGRDYDGLMDRYTYVLERLREDDCRRLRSFVRDGRSKFTTWLVVVASRLCIDHRRSMYGRGQGDGGDEYEQRRRLVDLVGENVELDHLVDEGAEDPQRTVEREERRFALKAAIDDLPPEDRVFLRLRFEDGRSASEIARVLGLASEFAAYRRQRAILARLRVDLVRHGVGEASS